MGQTNRKCLVVKSGRSTKGLADRFCGWTDPPLSTEGQKEIMALRQAIADKGLRVPKIWYVSDRRRAVETFEVLSAGTHAPVVRLTERLREMNFGVYENLTWEELPDDFQRHYENALTSPMDLRFPGGESFTDFCDRVTTGAMEILSYEDDDSDIGIICHEGSQRIWQLIAEDLPPSVFFSAHADAAEGLWLSLKLSDVIHWRRKHLSPPGNQEGR